MKIPVWLISLVLLATAGCQTDRERYNIQDPEPVTIPSGLMPADKASSPEFGRGYAGEMVSMYFGPKKDEMVEDPVLTFHMLALFEYVVNELQHFSTGVKPYQLNELNKSRTELREVIGLPKEISVNDAVNQLFSMSKFMTVVASQKQTEENPETSARRELIGKYKGRITLLLKKLKSQKDADQGQPKEKKI